MAATSLLQWKVDKPWLELKCALGEGPFYEKETNSVRLVDIKKSQILTVSAADNGDGSSLKVIQLDTRPTVTVDIEGVDPRDRILIGVKHGIAVLDRQAGTYEMLVQFNEQNNERIRSNDGAVDPHGKLWLGTMTDFEHGEPQPEGIAALYWSTICSSSRD
jgi:sugar lactone lactonase YvrE